MCVFSLQNFTQVKNGEMQQICSFAVILLLMIPPSLLIAAQNFPELR